MSSLPSGVVPASVHYLAPWCTEDDLPLGRISDSNDRKITDIQLGWMIAAATDLLYVLSGRHFKSGRSVVRPTHIVGPSAPLIYPWGSMAGYGSAWGFTVGSAWAATGFGWEVAQEFSEVVLQAPVTAINSVMVDGTVLDPSAYSLYDGRRLVRNYGGAWPWNQPLIAPVTQAGTWQIDYDWGITPPTSGRLACAELAIELALGFSGQDECRLPARVLSVASQGVNVAVGDALSFILADLTGLPICDAFLQAFNPAKLRRRTVFLAPNSVIPRSS